MTDTITDDYAEQNRKLHAYPGYGSSGHYWLGHVLELATWVNARSILDYGAGKATLKPYVERFGLKYTAYDPATFPKRPKGVFDVVVCLDVLEHIEPEKLDVVIQDLHLLTASAIFCNISTRPSTKTLDDGRNAHLIVEDWQWWKPRLCKRGGFRSLRVRQHADRVDFIGRPTHARVKLDATMIQRIRGK